MKSDHSQGQHVDFKHRQKSAEQKWEWSQIYLCCWNYHEHFVLESYFSINILRPNLAFLTLILTLETQQIVSFMFKNMSDSFSTDFRFRARWFPVVSLNGDIERTWTPYSWCVKLQAQLLLLTSTNTSYQSPGCPIDQLLCYEGWEKISPRLHPWDIWSIPNICTLLSVQTMDNKMIMQIHASLYNNIIRWLWHHGKNEIFFIIAKGEHLKSNC